MISAFGVEHGEVSKAFGVGALGSKIGAGTAKVGQKLRQSGANNMKIGRQLAPNAQTPLAQGFARGMVRGGARRAKAGGKLRSLGQGMQQRPGLTGGIAVGGATAGVGGGAAAVNNRRKY